MIGELVSFRTREGITIGVIKDKVRVNDAAHYAGMDMYVVVENNKLGKIHIVNPNSLLNIEELNT